MKIQFR
ncbi:hypothetical protein MXB_318 [Myxobolus squamalis]|nr:hypothetical protein MXB_318 [Myxobolus squamalis]